jgi:transposase InsO family protein
MRQSKGPEPLQMQPLPLNPMQSVSVDMYEVKSKHYIVMVDRFSCFCWTKQVPQNAQNSSTIIRIMDNWFRMIGYPQYVFSDSGPQFASAEFKAYCKSHFITPLISSACYPTSNGLAESSVKIVKHLLLKSESFMDFENRLYERQNMPSSGETMSPAEKNFKRVFRSHLPTLERFFNPVQKDSEAKVHFQVGDTVRIQNAVSKLWDDSGVIREVRESGRSYYIDRGSGRDIILRNNIYLKLIPERETKRNEFLDEQQKSDSWNDQQQQLRRSKRIENNSLRNAQQISNQQQQQIAGSEPRDTLKLNLRRSKRIAQQISNQQQQQIAGSESRDTLKLKLARSNFVERASASNAE